jgi:hypothetical protein
MSDIADNDTIPVHVGRIRLLFDAWIAKTFNAGMTAGAMAERNRIARLLKLLTPVTRGIVEQAVNQGTVAEDIFQQCFDAVAKRQAPAQSLEALEDETRELLARMKATQTTVAGPG